MTYREFLAYLYERQTTRELAFVLAAAHQSGDDRVAVAAHQ